MMKKVICLFRKFKLFITTTFIFISMNSKAQELETVKYVDINKYSGKWFEIASFPQIFQKGCHCTTAEYTMTPKGYIEVFNQCNKGSINGKTSSIKGKAFVEKNSGNAKLKVQFFWPFRVKYWIIDLGKQYEYAVVGHPNRKYLWILSRTTSIDAAEYENILERIKQKGFNISLLKKTIHQ